MLLMSCAKKLKEPKRPAKDLWCSTAPSSLWRPLSVTKTKSITETWKHISAITGWNTEVGVFFVLLLERRRCWQWRRPRGSTPFFRIHIGKLLVAAFRHANFFSLNFTTFVDFSILSFRLTCTFFHFLCFFIFIFFFMVVLRFSSWLLFFNLAEFFCALGYVNKVCFGHHCEEVSLHFTSPHHHVHFPFGVSTLFQRHSNPP